MHHSTSTSCRTPAHRHQAGQKLLCTPHQDQILKFCFSHLKRILFLCRSEKYLQTLYVWFTFLFELVSQGRYLDVGVQNQPTFGALYSTLSSLPCEPVQWLIVSDSPTFSSNILDPFFRGEICPCRHCRRQCKNFAGGVNFFRKQHIFSQN